MLLTIGALALLSVLTLSVNRAIVSHQSSALQTQAMLAALAEAKNLLEEISSKDFDQAVSPDTTGRAPAAKRRGPPPGKGPKDFTPPGLLKKEVGEEYPRFNDIDDFNGLKKKAWNPVFGQVDVDVEVHYVNPVKTSDITLTATTAKRVDVRVYTRGLEDTLAVQRVFFY